MAEITEQMQNLQIKLSYQEETIEVLNKTVSLQQQDIMHLKEQLQALSKMLKNLKQDDSGIKQITEETLPPHY